MSKPKKKTVIIQRALPVSLPERGVNGGKVEIIQKLLSACNKFNNLLSSYLNDLITVNGYLPQFVNVRQLDGGGLSERYKYECYNNVKGAWNGLLTTIDTQIIGMFYKTQRSQNEKTLFGRIVRAGYHRLGLNQEQDYSRLKIVDLFPGDGEVDYLVLSGLIRELVRLGHKMFQHVRKQYKQPQFKSNTTLTLGLKVVSFEEAKNISQEHVLRLSTLVRGQRLSIPYSYPTYTRKRLSELSAKQPQAIQIAVHNKQVVLRIVVQGSPRSTYKPIGGDVGLDVGAVFPIVTSNGDVFGKNFWTHIQHLNNLEDKAYKGARHQYAKRSDNPRIKHLRSRLRSYVKNEINRFLRLVIELYSPSRLIVERLDGVFTPKRGQLSKKLRKLFRKVGRGVFSQSIHNLSQEHGFEIVEVNPAYTSKGCHKCGNVDDENRSNRDNFTCTQCTYTTHADVQGAKHIRDRGSIPALSRLLGEKKSLGSKLTALSFLSEQRASYLALEESRVRVSSPTK